MVCGTLLVQVKVAGLGHGLAHRAKAGPSRGWSSGSHLQGARVPYLLLSRFPAPYSGSGNGPCLLPYSPSLPLSAPLGGPNPRWLNQRTLPGGSAPSAKNPHLPGPKPCTRANTGPANPAQHTCRGPPTTIPASSRLLLPYPVGRGGEASSGPTHPAN